MGLSIEDLSRDLSKYDSILKYLSNFTIEGRQITSVNHGLLVMLDRLCENQSKESLSKVRNYIENVLDKALKNSSLNQKYYDKILDYIDRQIGG